MDVLMILGRLAEELIPPESSLYVFIGVATILMVLINGLYSIRVFQGLCTVFNRKKIWVR